jgi:ABC-type transport system involved in Fe-S cluster assembly fused permease/ATPase subunit
MKTEQSAAGITTCLMAHGFSTAGLADRIIVPAEDGIAEKGSHRKLMNAAARTPAVAGYGTRIRILPR